MVLTSSLIQEDLHLHPPNPPPPHNGNIINPIAVNEIELTNAKMGTKVWQFFSLQIWYQTNTDTKSHILFLVKY